MENTVPSIFETFEPQLVLASKGKRLLNYLVDYISFFALSTAIFGFLFGVLNADMSNLFLDFSIEHRTAFVILDRLFTLLCYALFLGLQETIFKGKTLGKLISGTKAVNEDGSRISAGKAFMRGLSRAVPFCAFSALGTPSYPWQDRWTRTYVIDEKQSAFYTEQYYNNRVPGED